MLIAVFLQFTGSVSCAGQYSQTTVAIHGEKFLINGKPTYQGVLWKGNQIEGLLMNSRMVQGVFDDQNPGTAHRWKYPDTGVWDPDRNTAEFVRAMEEWKSHGLLAFTINLQGGSPMGYGNRDWHNSAYEADGTLKPAYVRRLKMILDQADRLGMVPILGLFYFGQDQRLNDDRAVINASRNVIDWLHRQGYRNILIEVANECDNADYDRSILKANRIHEVIQVIRSMEADGWRYPVSTSYNGGSLPRSNVLEVVDFVLLHGNGVHQPAKIEEMVQHTRKLNGYRPMPILFNEDDHYDFDKPDNNLTAAVRSYASWGFFDFRREGESNENGFQSVPVDWSISSDRKKAFFNRLSEITGSAVYNQ